MVVLIIVSIFSGFICYFIADKRGFSSLHWCLMGLLFGPFAIPFVYFKKSK